MDLKPFYDAARVASDKMQVVLNEMNTAFAEGTDEGKQKALDLRPALDQAKVEADAANLLYTSVRDASGTADNVAKLFVPVAGAAAKPGDAVKEMTRAAFMNLEPDAQMKFMKDGGKIVEAAQG